MADLSEFYVPEDLRDYIVANFTHTNVTGLGADPECFMAYELIGKLAYPSNGQVTVGGDSLIDMRQIGTEYADEVYEVDLRITCTSTTSQKIKEILTELRRIFWANNVSATRTVTYKFKRFEYNGLAEMALIQLDVECTKLTVKQT